MCDSDTANRNIDLNMENQNMDTTNSNTITDTDIKNVIRHFSQKTYYASSETAEEKAFLLRCINLMNIDYTVTIINNTNGELCAQYPSQIPILENERAVIQKFNLAKKKGRARRTTSTIYEYDHCDPEKTRDLFLKARLARCRTRFPVPTILYKGKYICRSATLSGGPEMYSRRGIEIITGVDTSSDPIETMEEFSTPTQSEWKLFDEVRGNDVTLLKVLNISTVVDLMVEKKKVKFGMYVTSSEKVDKVNRYTDFTLLSLPYPGCEFFKEFRDNSHEAEGLVFDWTQEFCDATMSIPDIPHFRAFKMYSENYKEWDIVTMTKNYLKFMLKIAQEQCSGLLIHCISGWDRTPLFISLLRLSLWADGLVHQSLDAGQILYITVTYDWMLFGHHLIDRIVKGEDIFLFCFYVLKYVTGDEFCNAPGRYKLKKHVEDWMNKCEPDNSELLMDSDIGASVSSKMQEPLTFRETDESNGNLNSGSLLDIQDTLALGASTSPRGKRTSPVPVPSGTRLKRTDSSTTCSSSNSNNSTNGSGSPAWQMVTGTGSVKGSDSVCSGDIPFSHSSMCTVVDGDEWLQDSMQNVPCRKERLTAVRNLFYSCYFATIGSDTIKYGPEVPLSTVLGNMVGFSQRP